MFAAGLENGGTIRSIVTYDREIEAMLNQCATSIACSIGSVIFQKLIGLG